MTDVAADSLFARLKADNRLPSPPGTAIRVTELCRCGSVELRDIATVIMSDPALSARVLKFANSPLLRTRRAVASVREAVLFLGLRTVKNIALGFSLASPSFEPICPEFDLQRFWRDSFLVAVTARRFAQHLGSADREEAFTAGQLARIGQLAFARGAPDEYSQVLRLVAEGLPLVEAERKILGTDHTQLGTRILTEWGLPDVLVRAVERAGRSSLRPDSQEDALAHIVHLALEVLPVFSHKGPLSELARQAARAVIEETLALAEPEWQDMARAIRADCAEAAVFFDVDLGGGLRVYDLYADAQEEAGRAALAVQLAARDAHRLRRAMTDRLTGVANRACFELRMAELLRGLSPRRFALLTIEVDRFAQLGSDLGLAAADRVLRQVARRLRTSLSDVDLLARWGGPRFVVVAPRGDRHGACVAAVRACRAVERSSIQLDSQPLQITVSVGLVYSSDYSVPVDLETLTNDGQRQLQLSKDAGGNTWSYLGRTASQAVAATQAAAQAPLP
ncbi:MAG: HDOD domain-containing protein [Phycisphaerae bacterium]|nr:HDOD domain-containing protein [Phycisphaerae bacterium]